jgi:hypothetical protein
MSDLYQTHWYVKGCDNTHTHTTKYGSTPDMSMVIATYNYGYT